MKICFVCHANICRSFLAQEILKDLAVKNGRSDIMVFSRGVYAREDLRPPQKIKNFLSDQGIAYNEAHFPVLISREDLKNASLVFVMTNDQFEELADKYSEYSDKIHLFLGEEDMEDPISLTGKAFEKTALKIKNAVLEIFKKL
ncbi:protein-tyrosine phosphatase [Elusimicrobium posterum]|uniref:arsenate reductase/protein-tyrosine-phosphatase family protein n=1 Tax=Elusimicrobium posterum TaxID=3116653 RepID=UPI003C72F18C